jgi:uncharacterized SAM-binding protein YcdF (DUF218 family)
MEPSSTFLFLSKLLAWLVIPFSLAGLLLMMVLVAGGLRPLARVGVALALALLWGGGCRWTSENLVRSLEGYSRPPAPGIEAEAIVVLGGGLLSALPPRRAVELSDAGDRVLEAARLWREGRAPRVVTTGGRFDASERPRTQASETAELLGFLGVPSEAIVEERRSRNTRENAVEARAVLEPLGVRRILLVTSALHMQRAAALFRAQGFEVIPAPTDYVAVDTGERSWQLQILALLPDADSLSLTTRALREWLGLAVAYAFGWIG